MTPAAERTYHLQTPSTAQCRCTELLLNPCQTAFWKKRAGATHSGEAGLAVHQGTQSDHSPCMQKVACTTPIASSCCKYTEVTTMVTAHPEYLQRAGLSPPCSASRARGTPAESSSPCQPPNATQTHPPHTSSCRRWEAGSKEGAGTQERPDPAQPFHALKSKHLSKCLARLGHEAQGESKGIY